MIKRSKYGVRTDAAGKAARTHDGIVFASKKEMRRWLELNLLWKTSKIGNLRREVPYRLEVNGVLVCKYIADFVYFDFTSGREVIEDTKSEITRKNRAYRIKVKLMKAVHGITIVES